jgi:N-acetylglucosaminyldiphosphoundecaprenol N-acetyl-beta-D-mannosaminyltransferase
MRAALKGGSALFCNSHMIVEGMGSPSLRRAMNSATWIFPDGMPILMALKMLGRRRAQRIAGVDALIDLCYEAQRLGLKVYFYGDESRTLAVMSNRLLERYPALRIAGMASPPFRTLTAAEEREHVERINASGAHLCFVALGCPKQECWIERNRDKCSAVLLGIGNACKVAAGIAPIAPDWMRSSGLEWMHRLAQEPVRLWRRYAATCPVFLNRFARQLWSR